MTGNFKSMFQVLLRWLHRYKWRILIGCCLVCFSIILLLEPAWFISAADSMRIPYAIFLVVFIVFFFIRSNYMLTTCGVIALLIVAPDIWPYFNTSDKTPAQVKAEKRETVASDFTVLHFNVKEKNKNIASVAESALRSDADMVSLQELHASSLQVIDTMLRKNYPYVLSDVSVKGFGMALYSKLPFENAGVQKTNGYPFLTCLVRIKEKNVRIISATTSTPTNEKDYAIQIKQFKMLTAYADTIAEPLIITGDMNAVPWSEQIKNFMAQTKLEDSRKDLSATYPAQSPLQIPIDYIFHSGNLHCKKFTTIGGTTSNHLGIIGYYDFKPIK